MSIVSYEAAKRQKDKTIDNPILKSAVTAVLRGWSVIPVADNKKPAFGLLPKDGTGKATWKMYQHTKPTLDELVNWSTAPKIGVVTGEISGVIVLDVDPGGMDSLKGKHLPVTPTVRTPRGGCHYYYKYPGFKVITDSKILGENSEVDIRGDGGYAILPESNGYEWMDVNLDNTPLSEPPDWLIDLLKPKDKPKPKPKQKRTPGIGNPKAPRAIGAIAGEKLKDWYRNEDFVQAAASCLGIPTAPIGTAFNCVIPGHEENTPSASLFRGENGTVVYRDWHGHDTMVKPGAEDQGRQAKFFYTLAEIRAFQAYGKIKELNKPEHALWALRLLVETGHVQPAFVDVPGIPENVPITVRKFYEGFVLLLACKWLHTPGEPTACTWGFSAAWCDVSERKAGAAMKYLLKAGHLIQTGEIKAGFKKMALFNLPGYVN